MIPRSCARIHRWILRASLCTVFLPSCSASTRTYDKREIWLASRPVLGAVSTVGASGAVSEGKECSLEGSDFGPRWDCTSYRELRGKILSLQCVPTNACAEVSLRSSEGRFVPLAERFMLRGVADVEGVVVERTFSVAAVAPTIDFASFGDGPDGLPLLHFETGILRVCTTPTSVDVTISASQEGEPLEVRHGTRSDRCAQVVTKAGSSVSIEAYLQNPPRYLARRVESMARLAEVERMTYHDTYCGGEGLGAVREKGTNRYYAGMTVRGWTARGSGALPGLTSRIEDAGVPVQRGSVLSAAPAHIFVFEGAPNPGASVVVTAGNAVLRIPIRSIDGACEPPTPGPF